MIIWIVGLPGSGKTTIAKELYQLIRAEQSNVLLVDGDEFRNIFTNTLGYTQKSRLNNMRKMQGFCRFLDNQQITTICATACNFPEILIENRKIYSGYLQVYLKVSFEEICHRDQKSLYSKALSGRLKNVIGVDIPFREPEHSDIVIENIKPFQEPKNFAYQIYEKIKKNDL